MGCCKGSRVPKPKPQDSFTCKNCNSSLHEQMKNIIARVAPDQRKLAVHLTCSCGTRNKIWFRR